MPSLTRRRLLGGGAILAAGAYGAVRLNRGATDGSLASWTPTPGTWPLRRYDPANTAANPHATPPRESPALREVASASSAIRQPRFFPVVGTNHVATYGAGVAVYPRSGGAAIHERDATTPLAGFGPTGRLHTVHRDPDGVDAPSAFVGYDPADRRETYRVPLSADHPTGLLVGSHEVYVGTEAGDVFALDPTSGRRWHVGGTMPALGDGRLYVAGALDGTVAYAPRTGLDRRLQVGPRRAWTADVVDGFLHLPAVADGRLVVGSYASDGGAVAAFDADTGDRLWEPRGLGTDVATPALVGDRGYTAVADGETGHVVALDLTTGDPVWRDAVEWQAFAPTVAGDTLVVAGERRNAQTPVGGALRAYDRATGDVLWTHTFEEDSPDGVALVEDRVFVTVGETLYAFA